MTRAILFIQRGSKRMSLNLLQIYVFLYTGDQFDQEF